MNLTVDQEFLVFNFVSMLQINYLLFNDLNIFPSLKNVSCGLLNTVYMDMCSSPVHAPISVIKYIKTFNEFDL